MWFDIYKGDMYMFSKKDGRFKTIDEGSVDDLIKEVENEIGQKKLKAAKA